MNARQTDSLAARLDGLTLQADLDGAGDLFRGLSTLVANGDVSWALRVAGRTQEHIAKAIAMIETELSESTRGKPKTARKQRSKR